MKIRWLAAVHGLLSDGGAGAHDAGGYGFALSVTSNRQGVEIAITCPRVTPARCSSYLGFRAKCRHFFEDVKRYVRLGAVSVWPAKNVTPRGAGSVVGCAGKKPRMPILPKECNLYPEHLFELPLAEAPWEVAHVRSRHEKLVARALLDEHKPFYLPQIEQKVTRGGRTFVSHLPMFPGYVFIRRVPGSRETLRRTGAVAAILEVADQAQLMAELHQLRDLAARGARFTQCNDLTLGDTVRVTEGAFKGYVGVVTNERGSLRLIIAVSMLHKQIAVEFPREMLVRAKPHEAGSPGATPRRRV